MIRHGAGRRRCRASLVAAPAEGGDEGGAQAVEAGDQGALLHHAQLGGRGLPGDDEVRGLVGPAHRERGAGARLGALDLGLLRAQEALLAAVDEVQAAGAALGAGPRPRGRGLAGRRRARLQALRAHHDGAAARLAPGQHQVGAVLPPRGQGLAGDGGDDQAGGQAQARLAHGAPLRTERQGGFPLDAARREGGAQRLVEGAVQLVAGLRLVAAQLPGQGLGARREVERPLAVGAGGRAHRRAVAARCPAGGQAQARLAPVRGQDRQRERRGRRLEAQRQREGDGEQELAARRAGDDQRAPFAARRELRGRGGGPERGRAHAAHGAGAERQAHLLPGVAGHRHRHGQERFDRAGAGVQRVARGAGGERADRRGRGALAVRALPQGGELVAGQGDAHGVGHAGGIEVVVAHQHAVGGADARRAGEQQRERQRRVQARAARGRLAQQPAQRGQRQQRHRQALGQGEQRPGAGEQRVQRARGEQRGGGDQQALAPTRDGQRHAAHGGQRPAGAVRGAQARELDEVQAQHGAIAAALAREHLPGEDERGFARRGRRGLCGGEPARILAGVLPGSGWGRHVAAHPRRPPGAEPRPGRRPAVARDQRQRVAGGDGGDQPAVIDRHLPAAGGDGQAGEARQRLDEVAIRFRRGR